MTWVKVQDDSRFVRDEQSGCIININDHEYNVAKQRRDLESQLLTMSHKVNTLEKQMSLVFSKLNEIK